MPVGRTLSLLAALLVGLVLGGLTGRWAASPAGALNLWLHPWEPWRWLLGHVNLPAGGMVLGALLMATLWLLHDAARARQLLQWLQADGAASQAPAGDGLWGELAYRIAKSWRQREQSLASSQAQQADFLSAIDASPNGVVILDGDWRITWCNRTAALHLGLDATHDVLQPITNLVRVPEFVAYLQSSNWAEPVECLTPSGHSSLAIRARPFGSASAAAQVGAPEVNSIARSAALQAKVAPVEGSPSQPKQGLVLISQDITERKRSEAMRRDFVANVSHEIRTPLTVLNGYVQSLAELPLPEHERKPILQEMGHQGQRLQSLVDDLLTLAQLEGKAPARTDQWVSVNERLEQALRDARQLSNGRHTISLQGAPAGTELAFNPGELDGAMANLLSNAVRYTPTGGQIQLRWAFSAGAPSASEARIEVQDSGEGIAAEHLPRLAERFYRVDGSRSRETGGTGLGLAIVKHVMLRHGGELQVRSQVGIGSTFALHIPASRLRVKTAQS